MAIPSSHGLTEVRSGLRAGDHSPSPGSRIPDPGSPLRPFLPAALLLLGAVAGGFWSGATALGATAVVLALLLVLGGSGRLLLAPLGVGTGWIGLAVAAVLAVTTMLSATPRAALELSVVLAALVVVPARVAMWSRVAPRVSGLAVGAVASLLGLWALAEASSTGEPVAMPLGHHLLLAPVLLAAWPAGWRAGASWSLAARIGFVAPAVLALLGTRSVVALGALAVQLVWLAPRSRRGGVGVGAVALGAGLAGLRLLEIVGGADESTRSRLDYARAGWRGVLESPWWGHGPGSTPWVLGRFHPGAPGELVGDLHSVVLRVAFETGLLGLVVALVVLVELLRRCRRDATRAGLLGVLGFLALEPTLGATAPWIALALAAGLALDPDSPLRVLPPRASGFGRWVGPVAGVVGGLVLLGPLFARFAWDRAAATEDPHAARVALERAVQLDGAFPLYAWRLALVDRDLEAAAIAARRAPGVAALALGAAALTAPGSSVAAEESARAWALDPGDPFVAWYQAQSAGDGAGAVDPLVLAIAGEPRLLAAPGLLLLPEASQIGLRRLVEDQSLEQGWRVALMAASEGPEPTRVDADLRRHLDRDPRTSLSVVLFRRRPWPIDIAVVPVDGDLADRIDLPPVGLVGK